MLCRLAAWRRGAMWHDRCPKPFLPAIALAAKVHFRL